MNQESLIDKSTDFLKSSRLDYNGMDDFRVKTRSVSVCFDHNNLYIILPLSTRVFVFSKILYI